MQTKNSNTEAAMLGAVAATQAHLQTRAIICNAKGIPRLEFIRSFERHSQLDAAKAWFTAIESI